MFQVVLRLLCFVLLGAVSTFALGKGYLLALPHSSASRAYGISADGRTIVGKASHGAEWEPFKWTIGQTIQWLGELSGGDPTSSQAWAVSADGSVVVGQEHGTGVAEAFRWTAPGGMAFLGHLPGKDSAAARGVSADGTIVAGYDRNKPFRWTSVTGIQQLPLLTGGLDGYAFAISGDGTTVVGSSDSFTGESRIYPACKWTLDGEAVSLGLLQGMSAAEAWAVSFDGSVIVGAGWIANKSRGFIWTEAGGMSLLSTPPNGRSFATCLSNDGQYVGGLAAEDGGQNLPSIWDSNGQRRTLVSVLQSAGVSTAGWTSFSQLFGIQRAGGTLYLAGYGKKNNRDTAFLAVVIEKPTQIGR